MGGVKVLISGASIAGPALALWLHRYGADVTVVERAPALRTGGQLVDVRGVGREVLKRMGIADQVRAAAEANYGFSLVGSRNRRKGRFTTREFGGEGPVADIEILRGELSRVIVEHTGAGVDYRFGDRIADLTTDTDGVDVTFASGRTERFDLVIGADGLHSEVRDLLLSPHERHLEHLGIYLCFWTALNHLNLKDWTVVYSEPGRTIGMRSILNNAKVMAFLGFRGGPPSYDWRDIAAQKRIALAGASGMGWEAAQLLSQIDTADDFWFDSCTQVKLPRWSSGRVVLLGDAAWCSSPLTGHGTTLAIVGAYVLAGELALAGGDYDTAFAQYERKLRPLTGNICRSARRFGAVMIPQTTVGIRLRNDLAQLLTHMPGKSLAARSLISVSNSFGLNEYAELVDSD